MTAEVKQPKTVSELATAINNASEANKLRYNAAHAHAYEFTKGTGELYLIPINQPNWGQVMEAANQIAGHEQVKWQKVVDPKILNERHLDQIFIVSFTVLQDEPVEDENAPEAENLIVSDLKQQTEELPEPEQIALW